MWTIVHKTRARIKKRIKNKTSNRIIKKQTKTHSKCSCQKNKAKISISSSSNFKINLKKLNRMIKFS